MRAGLAGRESAIQPATEAGHSRVTVLTLALQARCLGRCGGYYSVRSGELYRARSVVCFWPGSAAGGACTLQALARSAPHHLTNTAALPKAFTDSESRQSYCAVHTVIFAVQPYIPGHCPSGSGRDDIRCVPARASAGIMSPVGRCGYIGRPGLHRSGCVVRQGKYPRARLHAPEYTFIS